MNPENRSEPMNEMLTQVRFCDTCGMRTSHDGNKCLVCARQTTPTPKETEDDRVDATPDPSEGV